MPVLLGALDVKLYSDCIESKSFDFQSLESVDDAFLVNGSDLSLFLKHNSFSHSMKEPFQCKNEYLYGAMTRSLTLR